MFYCACRSYFVPCRTWLILLAKCIWSAWPSSIIFLAAACEWALYYYFFHLFNYQMCLPIPGISALSKSKPRRWPPVWSALLLCRPPPLTHHTRLPSSHQRLESSQLSPASGHPRLPFRLPAVLFPHFPCGSLSSSRSLPQRGLLRPFSSLSCLSTSTTTSHIVTASWRPSPCPPPSTHLHW